MNDLLDMNRHSARYESEQQQAEKTKLTLLDLQIPKRQNERKQRPPAELNYNRYGKKMRAGNTTFEMLRIPIGSTLTATFKGRKLKFETVDNKNMVKDLQNGKVMTISAVANDYLGGQNNGFLYFTYNGKRLSDIRAEIDNGYLPYLRTLPKQTERS